MTARWIWIVLLWLPLGASVAQGQEQDCISSHCDILPARLLTSLEDCDMETFDYSQTVEYSQLVTGARNYGPFVTLYPVYSFETRLDGTYGQDDPGFTAVPNPCVEVPLIGALPPDTGLYVDFLTEVPTGGGPARNLLYWDAVDDDGNGLDPGDVDWSPVPTDEFLRIDELGVTALADGGTDEVAGILVDPTSEENGGLHDHIDFELRKAAGGPPTNGVYMAKFDITMPGFAEGAPIYVTYGTISIPVDAEVVARTQIKNEMVLTLCSDGVDNDRDGFVDFAGGDPGCDSAEDDSEKSTTYECDDGIDNDGDGLIDHRAVDFGAAGLYAERDPDCDASGPLGVSEVPEPSSVIMLVFGGSLLGLMHRARKRGPADCA